MKATLDLIAPKDRIGNFVELIHAGIKAWVEAGAILVEMVDDDPQVRQKIIQRFPDISEAILSRFEAIGRRELHPKTLLNSSPGMLRLRGLPYEQQERYLTEPVQVAVPRMDGQVEIQRVMVSALSASQARQCIGHGGVLSIDAQKARLKNRAPVVETCEGPSPQSKKMREAYEGAAFEEPDEPPADGDGVQRMSDALGRAQTALIEARMELERMHAEHPMEGYIVGCLKGVGILRVAITEGKFGGRINRT